jgi:hypothetical protein
MNTKASPEIRSAVLERLREAGYGDRTAEEVLDGLEDQGGSVEQIIDRILNSPYPDSQAEPEPGPEQSLEDIYALLGRVVLVTVPLGRKKPGGDGWQQTTYQQTQTRAYQQRLAKFWAGMGNIAALLGPPSDNLMAIDLDDDTYVEEFVHLNPFLADTFRTKGMRGCQLWIRPAPETGYPNNQAYYPLKTKDGQKYGEWRCGCTGGAISVLHGKHPEGPDYQILVAKPPKLIDFATLCWPIPVPWTATPEPEPQQQQRAERKGDAKLQEEAQQEKIARQLEARAQKVAQNIEAYYDHGRKEFVLRVGTGIYQSRNEDQFKRDLRFRDLSTKLIPLRNWSQTDIALRHVQENKFVRYVGPLAGYNAGHYRINNEPVLVTTSPILIEPRAGSYPIIESVLFNLFGKPEEGGKVAEQQFLYFLAWFKLALFTFRNGERRKGQAIFLCGPHDCGKSFLQHYIITPLLGGRVAFPYKYLNGDSHFNAELFAAEHLCLDDDIPFTDAKARRRFGTYIKNVTASDNAPCFAKYQTPVTLTPFWRLTVSTNDEAENLMIIPVLDESLIDKVMLFETAKQPMPMPTGTDAEREAFRLAIAAELPAFAAALLRFEIPEEIRHARFGVRSYLNPRILELVSEIQPENKLQEVIDQEIFGMGGIDPWKGTATRLESALRGGSLREQVSRLLYSNNMCGILLNRLARKANARVTVTDHHGCSFYRISPPPK